MAQIVVHGDSAGGDTLLTVSDQVAVHLYYTQFAEDSAADNDRFPGSDKFGEIFATGTVLRLKPIEGLDLHLPFVYGYNESPFTGMTSQSGPFKNVVERRRMSPARAAIIWASIPAIASAISALSPCLCTCSARATSPAPARR